MRDRTLRSQSRPLRSISIISSAVVIVRLTLSTLRKFSAADSFKDKLQNIVPIIFDVELVIFDGSLAYCLSALLSVLTLPLSLPSLG